MRGENWSIKPREGSNLLYVVFYLPGGKRVAKSTGTSDPEEARLRAGEIWVATMRAAGQPVPKALADKARALVTITAAEFLADLETKAHEYKAGYVKRIEADIKLYIMPKTQEQLDRMNAASEGKSKGKPWQPTWTYLDEITSNSWAAETTRLHKKRGGPLGSRSIQLVCNTLRMLLRFGAEQGYITNVPELQAPKQKLVKREKRYRRAMNADERERLLKQLGEYNPEDHGKKHPVGTAQRFFTALFFTLFRKTEMFSLTLRWLNLDTNMVFLAPQFSKNDEEDMVPLHPRARAAILEQAQVRGITDLDTPIFGVIGVRTALKWALEKAGLDPKGITPHHFTRHTTATILAEQTTDREALKHAGRWKSNVVDDYIHVKAEHARGLMDKL